MTTDRETKAQMAAVGLAAADVAERLLAISLDDLEEYARHAAAHDSHQAAIEPVLLHEFSGRQVSEAAKANRAAAAAARALADARRVLEEVRA
jgi:hypothetical protein